MKKYKRRLSITFLSILLCISLVGCADGRGRAAYTQAILREGQDAGEEYIDSFVFLGSKDSQYQQVGNAVPPLLAEGIAYKVLENIE